MELRQILLVSWKEFKSELIQLLKASTPFLASYIILEAAEPYLSQHPSLFQTLLLYFIHMLLKAGIIFLGLQHLFKKRSIDIEVSNDRIIVYLLSSVYLAIALSLGLLFFVIPGLIILAGAFLMPIYILKDKQGPIEAISSSLKSIKPILLKLIGLFVLAFIGFIALSYALIAIPITLPTLIVSIFWSIAFSLLTLFNLCLMINLYNELNTE